MLSSNMKRFICFLGLGSIFLSYLSLSALGMNSGSRSQSSAESEDFFDDVEEAPSIPPTVWCAYKYVPCSLGYWVRASKEMVDGKRVALIVHGHNTQSIIDDFYDYGVYDLSEETFGSHDRNLEVSPNYWYGLDTLVHLGRFLSHDVRMPGDETCPRYDVVMGYAYSSANTLLEIAKKFTSEVKEFLKDAKHVDVFAHSMGGLVARWALEKEGLGGKYKNLVTFDSPHQGIAVNSEKAYKELVTQDTICTFDMMTVTPDPDDPRQSDFLKELNSGVSPFYETANYYTLVGNDFADLTYNPLPTFVPAKDSKFNVGSLVQDVFNYEFNGKVISDGLVPTYSSGGVVLKQKSKSYAEDLSHTQVVPLNHRTIVGSADDLWVADLSFPRKPQFIIGEILHNWINSWPLE